MIGWPGEQGGRWLVNLGEALQKSLKQYRISAPT